jgi:hypothetical protein
MRESAHLSLCKSTEVHEKQERSSARTDIQRYAHAFSDAMSLNFVLLALGCVLSLFLPNENRSRGALDAAEQDQLLAVCERRSGIALPE